MVTYCEWRQTQQYALETYTVYAHRKQQTDNRINPRNVLLLVVGKPKYVQLPAITKVIGSNFLEKRESRGVATTSLTGKMRT